MIIIKKEKLRRESVALRNRSTLNKIKRLLPFWFLPTLFHIICYLVSLSVQLSFFNRESHFQLQNRLFGSPLVSSQRRGFFFCIFKVCNLKVFHFVSYFLFFFFLLDEFSCFQFPAFRSQGCRFKNTSLVAYFLFLIKKNVNSFHLDLMFYFQFFPCWFLTWRLSFLICCWYWNYRNTVVFYRVFSSSVLLKLGLRHVLPSYIEFKLVFSHWERFRQHGLSVIKFICRVWLNLKAF